MSTLHHARRPADFDGCPHAEPSQARLRLTQRDLAERWHLSPRTLERWRWLKRGPAYLKVGNRVVYRLEDVEAYEAAHLRASAPS